MVYNSEESGKTMNKHNISAFELRPNNPSKKACLLIHGLYDSPLTMKDIANRLVTEGYIARGMLLPGHAGNPEDLHSITLEDWQKSVEKQVDELLNEVDEIALLGFSTGGALAIDYVLSHPDVSISHLILLAPAIKIRTPFSCLIPLIHLLSHGIPALKWLQKKNSEDYARYTHHSTNGAYQVYRLTQQLKNFTLNQLPPTLAVTTEDDMVISSETAQNLFQHPKTDQHQLLCYAKTQQPERKNTHYRLSSFPDRDILDFSHLSLCVSPDNSHYGRQPDYEQPIEQRSTTQDKAIKYGETSSENLKSHRMIRLSYNPDFEFMIKKIMEKLERGKPAIDND
jgi:esterase/lipase